MSSSRKSVPEVGSSYFHERSGKGSSHGASMLGSMALLAECWRVLIQLEHVGLPRPAALIDAIEACVLKELREQV